MHNRGRSIKSYLPLLSNVSPCRNRMAFWRKICSFWVQEFFWTHTFQVAFSDFQQESSFLTLLMVKKGQGLFFISEKRQSAFITSKKGQGAILTFKRRQGAILTFKKRQGAFLTFRKRQGAFLTFKKGQGAAPSEKRKTWTLLICIGK